VERGEAGELHISATYPSATRAAQIANAVADAYLHLVEGNDHGTLPCTAPSGGAAAGGSTGGSSGEPCAIESKQELDAAHLELQRLSQRMNTARDRVVAILAQSNTTAASRPHGARSALRKTAAHASSAMTARAAGRPRTLRHSAGGGESLLDAARADLDAARDAYFQVLDCYTASHSLCTAVSVPKLAKLVEGAAVPIEAEKPGNKGMLLMLTFVASAVLGCCRPLTYEPPR
jgi:hypothetical protein